MVSCEAPQHLRGTESCRKKCLPGNEAPRAAKTKVPAQVGGFANPVASVAGKKQSSVLSPTGPIICTSFNERNNRTLVSTSLHPCMCTPGGFERRPKQQGAAET